jgi:hypothetical protein
LGAEKKNGVKSASSFTTIVQFHGGEDNTVDKNASSSDSEEAAVRVLEFANQILSTLSNDL